ncbi:hypothetical protein ACFL48_00105 [Pseudomonadota bacterium]
MWKLGFMLCCISMLIGCESQTETTYVLVTSDFKDEITSSFEANEDIDSVQYLPFSVQPVSMPYLSGILKVESSFEGVQAFSTKDRLDGYAFESYMKQFPQKMVSWKVSDNPNIYNALTQELKDLEHDHNRKIIIVTDHEISLYYN